MKKLLLLQLALLAATVSMTQNLTYEWARPIGGSNFDQGNSVIVDKYRNVYTTGLFMDKVDFDPNPSSTSYLTAKGGTDIGSMPAGTGSKARGIMTRDASEDESAYYDFTFPCPDTCPDNPL